MENLKLRKAARKAAKIKVGIQGPSGSGKTYSSLLLAYGLVSDWSKIAVIDSENGSADLYSHLGTYNIAEIKAPYSPEKYIRTIDSCVKQGMEVIIIDSISHEWEGEGGILDIHGRMSGNSFQNWASVTPRHNSFINAILQAPVHVIATIRTKQDYVMTEKNGKHVPEKVGLKGVQRDGVDYELTVVFDLDIKHNAKASKDRTGLFADKPEFQINTDTGTKIKEWCGCKSPDEVMNAIDSCEDLNDLYQLYEEHPYMQNTLKDAFIQKKQSLSLTQTA